MLSDNPDYTIPGFWFIQTQREDLDCDGTYPLDPVVVLATDLDDAMNQADNLIVVPEDCEATGRLVGRRATWAEIQAWVAEREAAAAKNALEEAADAMNISEGGITYPEEWLRARAASISTPVGRGGSHAE